MLDWVLNARGKQIRPILTLLCARLKGKAVDATEVAAVIEICHTASLIHDDIIENILGKTSAMFSIACGSGAYEGKCKDSEVLAAERFAEKFGLLFQLRDDLLDFVSTDDLVYCTVDICLNNHRYFSRHVIY